VTPVSQIRLVLDASPLICLLGTGSPEVILAALPARCFVEERVLPEVQRCPFDNTSALPKLGRLGECGLLSVERMSSAAYAQYLALVSGPAGDSLGRGESASLAFAWERDFHVVLDDRKAHRVSGEHYPNLKRATTARLFRMATEAGGLTAASVAPLLSNALRTARMHVWPEDRSWVDSVIGVPGEPE
jgi:predicted nucleic acid-binding protein